MYIHIYIYIYTFVYIYIYNTFIYHRTYLSSLLRLADEEMDEHL